MHLLMCLMKIVHIKRKSHEVEIVFFHTMRDYSEVPILKRDATDENHCLFQ